MEKSDSLKIQLLTLYPEVFPGVLNVGAVGKALRGGQFQLDIINIRDFGDGMRSSVDDTPCGGGAGMVLRVDVVAAALDYALAKVSSGRPPLIVCPSPRGKQLQQTTLEGWASEVQDLIMICGRFEGLDQRLFQTYPILEVSLGDYIICGGEAACQVILEGLIRLRKNILGNEASLAEESFHQHLLEHPHYTRPVVWREQAVPEILLSGHHQKIKDWQLEEAKKITKAVRPDLWAKFKEQEE